MLPLTLAAKFASASETVDSHKTAGNREIGSDPLLSRVLSLFSLKGEGRFGSRKWRLRWRIVVYDERLPPFECADKERLENWWKLRQNAFVRLTTVLILFLVSIPDASQAQLEPCK